MLFLSKQRVAFHWYILLLAFLARYYDFKYDFLNLISTTTKESFSMFKNKYYDK